MLGDGVDRVQEVYATSYRRLVGQLTGVTGDPVEAEDAVMEAFARAVNARRSFLAADNPEAWLRTIAISVTRTRWRRNRFFRDMRDPDLAREIAERVDPPGFDEVVARASAARRRRRTTIASGLAAVSIVGGTVIALGGPGDRSAEPAPAVVVDAQLPADVRAVLDDDLLDLWAAAGSSAGSSGGGLAVLWRGCDVEPCRFAVVTQAGHRVAGVALGASFPRLSAVPGGWLVEDATGFSRVTSAGDRAQIYDVGDNAGSSDVMAGDTAVETGDGWRLLRGDKLIRVPSPDGGAVSAAHVTPDGQLVVVEEGPGFAISTTGDGRTWFGRRMLRYTEIIRAAVVAGHGDHVAVVFLGDDPDGSIPVVEMQLSHDAGATWSTPRGLDLEGADGVRNVSSLAVAPSGSTYVTTQSHGLIRIDADGNTRAMPQSSNDTSAFVLDDSVCVMAEAGRIDELRCSADDGTTWTPIPLPGLR